jgi:hypothetical protein
LIEKHFSEGKTYLPGLGMGVREMLADERKA